MTSTSEPTAARPEDATVQTDRARVERYQPTEVEPRWQARWAELGLYRTDLHDTARRKFYLLTMYPYPSGDLHIGHWYIKTPTDAIARFRRMHGDNVFLPIGFDAFGLPAENAAIKGGFHPREWTMRNIENMRRQLRTMGATFDWDGRGRHLRPELLPLEPVALPAVPRGGPRVSQDVAGRLVPERRHPGARTGRRHGPALLAMRRESREARPGPVVPADHELRRRAARLLGHRLARADPDHADELDRPVGGRRDRVRRRARRPPARRRRDPRLHDAARHALRGDVHGPRARSTRSSRS